MLWFAMRSRNGDVSSAVCNVMDRSKTGGLVVEGDAHGAGLVPAEDGPQLDLVHRAQQDAGGMRVNHGVHVRTVLVDVRVQVYLADAVDIAVVADGLRVVDAYAHDARRFGEAQAPVHVGAPADQDVVGPRLTRAHVSG